MEAHHMARREGSSALRASEGIVRRCAHQKGSFGAARVEKGILRRCAPQDDFYAIAMRSLRSHFLNSASNADRASSGVASVPREPVKSNVFAGAKNVQVFAAFFDGIRAGIGWVHSHRADVSKCVHWLHACSQAPHLRQTDSNPTPSRSSTFSPQCLHRKTTAFAWSMPRPRGAPSSLRGGRGPIGRRPEESRSESW